jgi:hypothetical protein
MPDESDGATLACAALVRRIAEMDDPWRDWPEQGGWEERLTELEQLIRDARSALGLGRPEWGRVPGFE